MGKKGCETKQHIKQQANVLFSEKGFKTVTMKDICEATGLSRGGLYRHYNSTEQIFSESMEKEIPASEILTVILNHYQLEMQDTKGVFDLILFSYQGVRMYSQLMPIQKETHH